MQAVAVQDEGVRDLGSLDEDREYTQQVFTAWLRDQTASRGWTQAAVAHRLHPIHPNTVELWFQGKRTPSWPALFRLARVFGSLPDELVELLREPPGETSSS